MKKYLCLLIAIVGFFSCKPKNEHFQRDTANPDTYRACFIKIVDIITHDIFAPPVASRIMAYSSIAGYEAMVPGAKNQVSLAGQLHDLGPTPQPEPNKEYCYPVAGSIAVLHVGKALIFSEDSITVFKDKIIQKYKDAGIPDDVLDRSINYGTTVGKHIMEWAAKDNYKQLRTAPKYTVKEKEIWSWKPTPPMYGEALEPNWGKMRTLVMDSASQFRPIRPTPFSMDKKSLFYRQAMEVYDSVANNNDRTRETALYWDDNAMAMEVTGHVMMSKKKISPGGHWICIADNATRKKGLDLGATAEAYAMVSIALYEGFISCWKEKYESEHIRPETYITQFINKEWTPFLQTPPFPEYTSGHSVISSSAAVVMTKYLGENFTFSDSTEMYLNMAPRTYESFQAAANEAAISRMYGGIHFRPGIENGQAQGAAVGNFIVSKIKTKK